MYQGARSQMLCRITVRLLSVEALLSSTNACTNNNMRLPNPLYISFLWLLYQITTNWVIRNYLFSLTVLEPEVQNQRVSRV